MKFNNINLKFFQKKLKNYDDNKIIYSNKFTETISFYKNNENHIFDYCGFSIIKSSNTNRDIKEMIYKNNIETGIRINDVTLKLKDIIIISPFTKISDILSSKSNNNLHNFYKENNCFNTSKEIEEFIAAKVRDLSKEFLDLIELDLSKCDIINYIDIVDEFVNQSNIKKNIKHNKKYKW